MDGLMEGRMDGGTGAWMGEWMEGWMEGRALGHVHVLLYFSGCLSVVRALFWQPPLCGEPEERGEKGEKKVGGLPFQK